MELAIGFGGFLHFPEFEHGGCVDVFRFHQFHHAFEGKGDRGLFKFWEFVERIREDILEGGRSGIGNPFSRFGDGDEYDAPVGRIALAPNETFGFEAVKNADHGAVAQVDIPRNVRSRNRASVCDAQQGHELGCGDLVLTCELPGMDIDGLDDSPQRRKNAEVQS